MKNIFDTECRWSIYNNKITFGNELMFDREYHEYVKLQNRLLGDDWVFIWDNLVVDLDILTDLKIDL